MALQTLGRLKRNNIPCWDEIRSLNVSLITLTIAGWADVPGNVSKRSKTSRKQLKIEKND